MAAEKLRTGVVEDALQIVLFVGVIISIALSLIGLLSLATSGQTIDLTQTESLSALISSITSMSSIGLISLGILIIIATPIIRIIMTAVYFARRDRLLTAVPIVVLILITLGFVIAM